MRSISSRGSIVFTYTLSPEERYVVYPVGVQLILFPFIVVLGNVYCRFKNRLGFLWFLNLENVLSPVARAMKCSPMGYHLILSLFLYLTSDHFFDFKNLYGLSRFLTPQFFIPRCGSYVMLPYGVPFDSLSFLYLTSGHFFDFKNLKGLSRFLTPQFFITRRGGQ